MDKLIYMDNAATTSTSPEVISAMLPFLLNITAILLLYIILPRKAGWQLKRQGKL